MNHLSAFEAISSTQHCVAVIWNEVEHHCCIKSVGVDQLLTSLRFVAHWQHQLMLLTFLKTTKIDIHVLEPSEWPYIARKCRCVKWYCSGIEKCLSLRG